jgi:WD40 repeat protein
VRGVAFAPGGNALAAVREGGPIRAWDTASGKELAVLQSPFQEGHHPISLAFTPGGAVLASGGYRNIKLWDVTGLLPAPK